MSRHLYRHLKAPLKKAETALERCASDPGRGKNIHNLRTSIKKLKACLKLAKRLDEDLPYHKISAPWKKIFQIAAESRDMLVANKMLHTEQTTENQVETAAAVFEKALSVIDSRKKETRHALKRASEKRHAAKHLKKYCHSLLKKIDSLASLKPEKRLKKLHVLRKALKELYYNLPILDSSENKGIYPAELKPWLKKTTDLLGKWHDCKMTLEKISNGELQPGSNDMPEALVKKVIHRKHVFEVRIGHICDDKATLAKMLPKV